MSNPGEPTVPFEWRTLPPAEDGHRSPYDEPQGYPTQAGYEPGYPVVQPQPYAPVAQPPAYGPVVQSPAYGPVVQPPAYGSVTQPAPYYGYLVDPRQLAYQETLYAAQKSRIAAGLLGLFLGCFGIHNFYLGRTGIGVLQLLLTVFSVGILAPGVAIWVLIESIMILTRSPSFATDAKGIPLRD